MPDKTADRVETLLATVMHRLSLHDDESTRHDVAVTTAEATLMVELLSLDEATQQELAARLGVDKSRISRLCASLERKRFLGRQRDESNRRNLLVKLTPSGAAVARRLRKLWRLRHERMLAGMTAQERRALLVGLSALARELAALHGISPASEEVNAAATASGVRATPRR